MTTFVAETTIHNTIKNYRYDSLASWYNLRYLVRTRRI